MEKQILEERFRLLLVEELKLFDQNEYTNLRKKAEVSGRFSKCWDRFDVFIRFFDEPLFRELNRCFNYYSKVCYIHVRLDYLYNTSSLYKLLLSWFDQFLTEEREDFRIPRLKEGNIIFDFPQLIIRVDSDVQERFISPHLENLRSFLEYIFSYHRISLSVKKVESIPISVSQSAGVAQALFDSSESTVSSMREELKSIIATQTNEHKGVFRLYCIEEEEGYGAKRSKSYRIGFTNFSDHYYLLLGSKVKEDKKKEILDVLRLEEWYEIEYTLDSAEGRRSSRVTMKCDGWLMSCTPTEPPEEYRLVDDSPKKAFPLNVYTKYSSFDGLFSSDEWAILASKLGHSVLALTDFNNVHVFPEAEKSTKKNGLKPLYGAEVEVISEELQICTNLDSLEERFRDPVIYSIFDLETTGLHPLFDEIIEIYVIKYSGGREIDSYHSYLKCDKELTTQIVDLTNITAEKLDIMGRPKREVLSEVREFMTGTVLMAHNGLDFDLPFLNVQMKLAGLEPLDQPLLDTILLAKALDGEKKSKSFTLHSVAKKLSIPVAERELHSAEYDTGCLLKIWKVWETLLIEKGLDPYVYENLEGINNYFSQKSLIRNYFGSNVILFAKNQQGIYDLFELISAAHTECFVERPRLTWQLIDSKRKNLIVLSSPTNSELIKAAFRDDFSAFEREGRKLDYVSIPPPSMFLHEMNRFDLSLEQIQGIIRQLYEWGNDCKFKLVANYCLKFQYYREVEQYKVLVHAKIIGGKRHPLHSTKFSNDVLPDYSLRLTKNFIEEFSFLGLNKKEIDSLFFRYREEIVKSISSDIQINKPNLSLPVIGDALAQINQHVDRKLTEKYGPRPHSYLRSTLDRELKGIKENGFESVFWCAHLLVERSKKEGYLVGSRGSVGSSFLAHMLDISEVNPLPPHYYCSCCSHFVLVESFKESGFDLEPKRCPNCSIPLLTDGQTIPFETFMGLEGNKVPDIDLNFSGQYQQEAQQFLRELFGTEHTFRAGTVSAIAEKTAYALAQNYVTDNKVQYNKGKLHWLSWRLADVKRTTGQHPGGIIVIPKGQSIYTYTPVNYPANDTESEWLTTHFDKDALKDSLFKFDILGQDDPTILALLSRFTGVSLDKISHNDKKILRMFSDISVLEISPKDQELIGESIGTIGLPEFGTEKTREILRACREKIRHFSDLIRISGISHGKNVWKNNIEKLISDHKHDLHEVITCRDDIMNYLLDKKISIQQSFKITESVRRGGGIPQEDIRMLKEAKVPAWYIECANKITYIFPKAHATAYVLMCWKIAFFKLYYPVEFYAAYLTITNKHFDIETLLTNDLVTIRDKYSECKRIIKSRINKENIEKTKYLVIIYEVALEMISRGIKFKMVDINSSLASTFKPDRMARTIQLPFSCIPGLGIITAAQLEEEREEKGDYVSREDLESRVKLNVTLLKSFEKLGIISPRSSKS
ncbi:DNA polymerase III polC-type [Candidatus Mycoplasma haematolamae str. Purdue]|uniref:DNA polymerase III PolC-type n=1 Tax=Mycoplasma haematolamae (strain Purdue) TaxID=1212765 RepID=I7B941_MYCHA|nr:PolC-type DNA polymerase III [Candidatus Mycoplasma haematolamae]AFO51785.1 DNA polymerase III polC-type [Candidatus Mycoplasma haematolamae str. Purdue]